MKYQSGFSPGEKMSGDNFASIVRRDEALSCPKNDCLPCEGELAFRPL